MKQIFLYEFIIYTINYMYMNIGYCKRCDSSSDFMDAYEFVGKNINCSKPTDCGREILSRNPCKVKKIECDDEPKVPVNCIPPPPSPSYEKCRYVGFLLDQLLSDTLCELKRVVSRCTCQLHVKLKNSLKMAGDSINQKVIETSNIIASAIAKIIDTSNSDTITAIEKIVVDGGDTLLAGINKLIADTEDSITKLITNLSTQPDADVIVIIKDLTTTAGLLSQINAFMVALTNGINALFATETPAEIDAVSDVLKAASSKVIQDVKDAISVNTTKLLSEILKILTCEAEAENNLISKYLSDILGGAKYIFIEYGKMASQIVSNVLCCGIQPEFRSNSDVNVVINSEFDKNKCLRADSPLKFGHNPKIKDIYDCKTAKDTPDITLFRRSSLRDNPSKTKWDEIKTKMHQSTNPFSDERLLKMRG